VHRRVGDLDVYLVINTGPKTRSISCIPRDQRSSFQVWDPADGRIAVAGPGNLPVPLHLEPYQAAVIIGHDGPAPRPALLPPDSEEIRLDSGWTVRFGDADPQPVELPHRWEDDPARTGYSGSAEYRATVDVSASSLGHDRHLLLDFGSVRTLAAGESEPDGMRGNSYRVAVSTPVREVVEVFVNEQPCGILWRPPYRTEVGAALRPGSNDIRLRVSNTAANALSQDTAIGRIVDESRKHYGRRFQMQDLDRALDGVSSGLLEVPVLRRLG
jgi:hypothetical protein